MYVLLKEALHCTLRHQCGSRYSYIYMYSRLSDKTRRSKGSLWSKLLALSALHIGKFTVN